jgi:hypothetical protein
LMKMLWSKFAIWVTDAGPIIISPRKSKLDSIDLQRSLLVQTTILQLIFGHLPAQYLKWLLEISSLNQEREATMTKMMTIWPR